jgi:hypothetical protein
VRNRVDKFGTKIKNDVKDDEEDDEKDVDVNKTVFNQQQQTFLNKKTPQVYFLSTPTNTTSPSNESLFSSQFVPLHCSQQCRENGFDFYQTIFCNNLTQLSYQNFNIFLILNNIFAQFETKKLQLSSNPDNFRIEWEDVLTSLLELNEDILDSAIFNSQEMSQNQHSQFGTPSASQPSTCVKSASKYPKLVRFAAGVNEFHPVIAYPDPAKYFNQFFPRFSNFQAYKNEFSELYSPFLMDIFSFFKQNISVEFVNGIGALDDGSNRFPDVIYGGPRKDLLILDDNFDNFDNLEKNEKNEKMTLKLQQKFPNFILTNQFPLYFTPSRVIIKPDMIKFNTNAPKTSARLVQSPLLTNILNTIDVRNIDFLTQFLAEFKLFVNKSKITPINDQELSLRYSLYVATIKPHRFNSLIHHSVKSGAKKRTKFGPNKCPDIHNTFSIPNTKLIKLFSPTCKNPKNFHRNTLYKNPLIKLFFASYKYPTRSERIQLLRSLRYYFPNTNIPTLLSILKPSFIQFTTDGFPDNFPQIYVPKNRQNNTNTLIQHHPNTNSISNIAIGHNMYQQIEHPTQFNSNSIFKLINPLNSILPSFNRQTFFLPSKFTFRALLRLIKGAKTDSYLLPYVPKFGRRLPARGGGDGMGYVMPCLPYFCQGVEFEFEKKRKNRFIQGENNSEPNKPNSTDSITHLGAQMDELSLPIDGQSAVDRDSVHYPMMSLECDEIIQHFKNNTFELELLFRKKRVFDFLSSQLNPNSSQLGSTRSIQFDVSSTNFNSHIIKHSGDKSEDEIVPPKKTVSFSPVVFFPDGESIAEYFVTNNQKEEKKIDFGRDLSQKLEVDCTCRNWDNINSDHGIELNPVILSLCNTEQQERVLQSFGKNEADGFIQNFKTIVENVENVENVEKNNIQNNVCSASQQRPDTINEDIMDRNPDYIMSKYTFIPDEVILYYQNYRKSDREKTKQLSFKTIFPTSIYPTLKTITFPFDKINPNSYSPTFPLSLSQFRFLSPFIFILTQYDQIEPVSQIPILKHLLTKFHHNGLTYPESFREFDKLRQAVIATTVSKHRQRAQKTKMVTTGQVDQNGIVLVGAGKFPSYINASAATNSTVGQAFREAEAKRIGLREINISQKNQQQNQQQNTQNSQPDVQIHQNVVSSQSLPESALLIPNLGLPTPPTTKSWTPPVEIKTDFSALTKPITREGARRRQKAVVNARDLWEHPEFLLELEGHGAIVDTQINALHSTTLDSAKTARLKPGSDDPPEPAVVKEFFKANQLLPRVVGEGEISIPAFQKEVRKEYREYGELSNRVKILQQKREWEKRRREGGKGK